MTTHAYSVQSDYGMHVGFIPMPFDHLFWDLSEDRGFIRKDAKRLGYTDERQDGVIVRALGSHSKGSFMCILESIDHAECDCDMGDFVLMVNFDFAGDFQTLEEAKARFDEFALMAGDVDIIPV